VGLSRKKIFNPLESSQRLIGSYIRSWERPGDLPRVIEILCLCDVYFITLNDIDLIIYAN
jgi:hypothetical protein